MLNDVGSTGAQDALSATVGIRAGREAVAAAGASPQEVQA